MKTTITLKNNLEEGIKEEIEKDRLIYCALSESDSYLYHLSHPEIDSYILYSEHYTKNTLKMIIDRIHYINSIITILIHHSGTLSGEDFIGKSNIILFEKNEQLPVLLRELPEIHRSSNRIEWPVKVSFHNADSFKEKHSGIILSISSGGCFIRSEKQLKADTSLILTIKFKEFDFFSEGIVLRIEKTADYQTYGAAIQFSQTSPQTKKYIQDIINEKILTELSDKLNLNPGTKKDA